jgi:hypothetical protein
MDRKYHILYVSYEGMTSGRSYVGAHSTDDLQDGYFGSYVDKSFSPTHKIIVGYYNSREALLKAEETLQKSLDVVRDPRYANQSIQHGSGFTYGFLGRTHSQEFVDNLSQRNKERVWTPQMKEAASQSQKERWRKMSDQEKKEYALRSSDQWKGVSMPEEQKRKIGESQMGEKNHRFGKTESPETREKKAQKMRGRYWGNNGVEEKMFTPEEAVPDGWVSGRLKTPFLGAVKGKGKKWYTDGVTEKMLGERQEIPEGWGRGRLKKVP